MRSEPRVSPQRYPFAAKLREVRLQRKLTLETVAEAADISAMYLGELERGKKPNASTEVTDKLAKALGIRAPYLRELAVLQRTLLKREALREQLAALDAAVGES